MTRSDFANDDSQTDHQRDADRTAGRSVILTDGGRVEERSALVDVQRFPGDERAEAGEKRVSDDR